MPSIIDSHNELIGSRYLPRLPKGGKRAYKIMHTNPQLIQNLLAVAERFEKAIKSADSITIATGFPVYDTFETDGPIGTYILGNFLIQQGYSVNITSEPALLEAMEHFPWDGASFSHLSFTPTSQLKKSSEFFISIERPGQNFEKIYHNMRGDDISSLIYDLDDTLMKFPPKYWMAIGDGGNELGLGALQERIQEIVPFGKKCNCPCGGGIAVEKRATDYVLGITSNLAALMLTLELALKFSVNWKYRWETEKLLLKILNSHKIIDGINGEFNSVDGISPILTKEIVQNMNALYDN
ncbi:MAG: glutamate cyclase domain-containing protein [Promethearchaeota archaeon]